MNITGRNVFTGALVATLLLTGCATEKTETSPNISLVKFDDPVCSEITLEILDAFHIPHDKDQIPFNVWHQWACVRATTTLGRATLVLLWEPKGYQLTFTSDKDGRISGVGLDPGTYQEVIGGMVIHGRVDSLTDEGRKWLEKNGQLRFTVKVLGLRDK
jgi:hypothetical protein